jgi:hypothetical protein
LNAVNLDGDERRRVLDVDLVDDGESERKRLCVDDSEGAVGEPVQRQAAAVKVRHNAPPVRRVAVLEHDADCAVVLFGLDLRVNGLVEARDRARVQQQHGAACLFALVARRPYVANLLNDTA